eukprot:RCo045355
MSKRKRSPGVEPKGGLQLCESVGAALQLHSEQLDAEVNALINEVVPKRVAEVEELMKSASELTLAERQATVSRLHAALARTLDTFCHWIAMRQERLECGNEFGSEVQVTVASCISRSTSTSGDRRDSLRAIIM